MTTSIDVYPVGLLADLKHHRSLRHIVDTLRRVRNDGGAWRMRGYLNGYLAEINYPPEGLRHLRCGHGWTQRRALARLGLYLAQDNPGQGIAGRRPAHSAHVVGPLRWWVYALRDPRLGAHLTWHDMPLGAGYTAHLRALDVHFGSRGLAVTRA